MNKLCVFFVIVVFTNGALGQRLEDIFGVPKQNAPTTVSPAVTECIRNCPVTPEYNPICGTDNVTYDNLGRLNCAQACGVNVNILRMSRCVPPDNK